MSTHISGGAVKIIELIGVSEKSFEDAVHQAVAKAAETISGITGVEVFKQTATVQNGKIQQFRTSVRIAFVVQ